MKPEVVRFAVFKISGERLVELQNGNVPERGWRRHTALAPVRVRRQTNEKQEHYEQAR